MCFKLWFHHQNVTVKVFILCIYLLLSSSEYSLSYQNIIHEEIMKKIKKMKRGDTNERN